MLFTTVEIASLSIHYYFYFLSDLLCNSQLYSNFSPLNVLGDPCGLQWPPHPAPASFATSAECPPPSSSIVHLRFMSFSGVPLSSILKVAAWEVQRWRLRHDAKMVFGLAISKCNPITLLSSSPSWLSSHEKPSLGLRRLEQ